MFYITNIETSKDKDKFLWLLKRLNCVCNGGVRIQRYEDNWFIGSACAVFNIDDDEYPGGIPRGCTAKYAIWWTANNEQYWLEKSDYIIDIHNMTTTDGEMFIIN